MSPTARQLAKRAGCFPRVSGDEPGATASFFGSAEFSPRERG